MAPFWCAVLTAVLVGCGVGFAVAEGMFDDDIRRFRAIMARFKADPQFELPKVLPCLEQPQSLTGLSRAELQDRCGPWQQVIPVAGNAAIEVMSYRRNSGHLLMQVQFADGVVSSAAVYVGF